MAGKIGETVGEPQPYRPQPDANDRCRQSAGIDGPYAWRLAFVSMFCIGLGGGAIYLPVVGLKEIAAEFGDRRAVPSMAYMLGFFFMGVGGVLMGWLADRTSPRVPLLIAPACRSSPAAGWPAAAASSPSMSAIRFPSAFSAIPPPSRRP